MRRMSPPRTIRRVHGASYGGCLVYIVGILGVMIGSFVYFI